MPHTADLRIEAWAPTREECVEEAVTALVEGVVDLPAELDDGVDTWFPVPAATDADLLVMVLDEVIYRMDTTGQVPVRTKVSARTEDSLDVLQRVVDLATVDPAGAAPKGISLHGLALAADDTGWRCAVTVDV